MRNTPLSHSLRYQRGISLFIVIVIVMLSMLLALWSARTSLFNELVVGNDADYQRAFEAAQALLQDAEFDIRGERPDGMPCVPEPGNVDKCRPPPPEPPNPPGPGADVWFPTEDKEFGDLMVTLNNKPSTHYCLKGMCLKRIGNQDFWNDKATLNAMLSEGARYGQFTGAEIGAAGSIIEILAIDYAACLKRDRRVDRAGNIGAGRRGRERCRTGSAQHQRGFGEDLHETHSCLNVPNACENWFQTY